MREILFSRVTMRLSLFKLNLRTCTDLPIYVLQSFLHIRSKNLHKSLAFNGIYVTGGLRIEVSTVTTRVSTVIIRVSTVTTRVSTVTIAVSTITIRVSTVIIRVSTVTTTVSTVTIRVSIVTIRVSTVTITCLL